MEVVNLSSHFSYTFIKGVLNKNCPHANALKLWFYNFAKTNIHFFAKLMLTISQELSRIDEDFLCTITHIWQWRHPAVLAICRLYPTYKVTKNLGVTLKKFIEFSVTRWWNKKSCLLSPEIAQKVATHFLHNSDIIRNSPNSHQNVWATFVAPICCHELVKIAQSGHTDSIR